jgi:short-subunit dehydrogenase
MQSRALLIGTSDGMGLAASKRLLARGWDIIGVSRRASPVAHTAYHHEIMDVADRDYISLIESRARGGRLDLCIYFAGIGELLDPADMRLEPAIIDVNLTGMVRTASVVIPQMVKQGQGHFIGISSLADVLLSAEAPSYHASKAGFSNYLGGLALAVKPKGVHVTNVRFGFVDTKMAKGTVKPLMMSVEKAVDHLETCLRKKPACYTAPRIAIPLVAFRKFMMKLGR